MRRPPALPGAFFTVKGTTPVGRDVLIAPQGEGQGHHPPPDGDPSTEGNKGKVKGKGPPLRPCPYSPLWRGGAKRRGGALDLIPLQRRGRRQAGGGALDLTPRHRADTRSAPTPKQREADSKSTPSCRNLGFFLPFPDFLQILLLPTNFLTI